MRCEGVTAAARRKISRCTFTGLKLFSPSSFFSSFASALMSPSAHWMDFRMNQRKEPLSESQIDAAHKAAKWFGFHPRRTDE